MAKSTTYANEVLDALFGSGTPGTLYIGLFTSMPASDGTGGTEVAGGSYARSAITNNATNFPAASAGEKSNANPINFATPTANWGTVVGIGIFAGSSGGTPKHFGELVESRTINNGDGFQIAATQLVIREA